MSHDDNTHITFNYSGFGRNISFSIDDSEAEFYPSIFKNFAEFMRTVGFSYIGVKKTEDGYLFHSKYTDDDWFDEQDIDNVNAVYDKALEEASAYWDKQFEELREKAKDEQELRSKEPPVLSEGDYVYYHGQGEPEDKFGHAGNTGVDLKHMRGLVIKVRDSHMGPRYLIRFDNWNDGHNGLGDDPDARMSSKAYWWVSPTNIAKAK